MRPKDQYSVETTNIFAGLSDCSSDDDIYAGGSKSKTVVPKKEQKKGQHATSKISVAGVNIAHLKPQSDAGMPRAAGYKLSRQNDTEEEGSGRNRGREGGYKSNRYDGWNAMPPSRDNKTRQQQYPSDDEQYNDRDRHGQRVRTNEFRGRGERRQGTTRHREYDRHVPGTNRPRGLKKGGAGRGNWGSYHATCSENVYSNNYAGSRSPNGNDAIGEVDARHDLSEFPEGSGEISDPDQNNNVNVREDVADDFPTQDQNEDSGDFQRGENAQLMGLDEYHKILAAKRSKLPTLPHNDTSSTKSSDIEADGYTLHIKQSNYDAKKQSNLKPQSRGNRPREYQIPLIHTDAYREDARGRKPRSARGGRGRGRGGPRGTEQRHVPPAFINRTLDLADQYAFPSLAA